MSTKNTKSEETKAEEIKTYSIDELKADNRKIIHIAEYSDNEELLSSIEDQTISGEMTFLYPTKGEYIHVKGTFEDYPLSEILNGFLLQAKQRGIHGNLEDYSTDGINNVSFNEMFPVFTGKATRAKATSKMKFLSEQLALAKTGKPMAQAVLMILRHEDIARKYDGTDLEDTYHNIVSQVNALTK